MPTKKMSLPDMREIVLQEMDHIPRWPKEQQSELRMEYWLRRMNSLGKKAEIPDDRSQVMRKCLESVKKRFPGADFSYARTDCHR